jgi:hypothetical protein
MTEKKEIWADPEIIARTELLLDNYKTVVGRSLLDRYGTPLDNSNALFHAPFVVVSHGTETDPIFNYGNRAALDLWEMTWVELTALPSRVTVGEDTISEEERGKMLFSVREKGYIDNYKGVRVSRSGRRFYIEEAIVWNVLDRSGEYRGQAATFARWAFL